MARQLAPIHNFASTYRGARISARKVRLVADLIRGKPVPQARAVLCALSKRGAVVLLKVLNTAVANAEAHDEDVNPEELVVISVQVNEGAAMKRARFRAYGRVARYKHRTSHITVVVGSP